MRSDKHQHKNRKKRKRKAFLLVLLILIAAVFAYIYWQFRAGVSESTKDSNVEKVEYEFNGEKDEQGWTNTLLIGSDTRGEKGARSDTIMIAHYHKDKGIYKITSIMRDSYVEIPGHGKNKINAAFAFGGPELLRQTIKDNFGLDIQYYSIVDFEGFVQLIDEAFPDGVEVDVEKHMSDYIGVTLEPGVQQLDGEHLLGYVRFRNDTMGDFTRVERQQKVVKNVAGQLTSLETVPKLPKLIGVVTPFINTNLNTATMLFMGKDFLTAGNKNIESLTIPVEGGFKEQRVSGIGDILAPDLEKNRAALDEFLKADQTQ
ncbi:transcriptional regulator [Bacillus canaveralius]|uniref:Regulatory protein MsrR n=1 Tax=Bacillus canaveralius TaxID=1403243 RepID=A0A2N5GPP4_9BACI|nr:MULTISPECIES: LCP family protein [Bacillus]PLR84680.1 transcriptional regulator [Bacillus canaveralius]PLR87361.1 transcriptional regulator [Bacillus sp. V33-4]PLR88006.1 transcriptional regulator [Bacillus canaveralius]RSK53311.1 LytR family transcriptional regulator [Bacillus canaveralius]